MKLYFASAREKEAIDFCKATFGRRWKQRISPSVSEEERRLRGARFEYYPHAYMWAARPFGHAYMNRLLMVARHCLRRNTYFRAIARKLATQPA